MERATHPVDEHADAHPAPLPRDPDLPNVSDSALMLFAAAALLVALAGLLLVVD